MCDHTFGFLIFSLEVCIIAMIINHIMILISIYQTRKLIEKLSSNKKENDDRNIREK